MISSKRPPFDFLLQKQIFSETFRSGVRSGRMMDAFQIFKRPGLPGLGVWTFGVIRGGHRGNLGFPLMMKIFDGDPWENSWDRQLVRISF